MDPVNERKEKKAVHDPIIEDVIEDSEALARCDVEMV